MSKVDGDMNIMLCKSIRFKKELNKQKRESKKLRAKALNRTMFMATVLLMVSRDDGTGCLVVCDEQILILDSHFYEFAISSFLPFSSFSFFSFFSSFPPFSCFNAVNIHDHLSKKRGGLDLFTRS